MIVLWLAGNINNDSPSMQNLNDGPCSTIIYLLGSIVNESWVFTAKGFVF